MIQNTPSKKEFEELGLQCITKAFEMLFKLEVEWLELSEDEAVADEVTEDDFWKHNAITVRTSLIVLFQGVEYLMKMCISADSPLLLIENNKTDWPTLPSKKDKNFDELQTISGESLLSVFCAVVNDKFDLETFVKAYEDLRLKRNKLVHSTGVKNLEQAYVIKQDLLFISLFYDNYKWLELFRRMFISEPAFGYWDWDIEEAYFYRILDFTEKSLSKSELDTYIPFNIKARRYLCPSCTYWLNKDVDYGPQPKWAFLNPNTPQSDTIECLICNKKYKVERKNCFQEDCKGNVISNDFYEDQCLTCSE